MVETTDYKRKNTKVMLPQNNLGKLPPQAVDMEEAVLGAILLHPDTFLEASGVINSDCFYKDSHRTIFRAITNLFNTRQPIDLLTVTAELRKMGELEMIGGAWTLTELTSRVVSYGNVETHSRHIMEKYLQRELIRISSETISKGYDDTEDVFDLIEQNQSQIFNLIGDTTKKDIEDIGTLGKKMLAGMHTKPVDGLTGVGSGFKNVDTVTGGWQDSDLIIVAARPAMGKTAFVLKCARNAAIEFDKPVVIFSLEMSAPQLVERMAADEGNVRYENIKKKRLDANEILNFELALSDLLSAKIHIDDTASLNIFDFRVKCRRLKQKFDIGLIIVDYLQLMTGVAAKGNREQEIGSISRALKAVAKELNVPVIALSQLSRAVESRPGNAKRPMLSDLRESGSLEQDADMVGFLYRPEYYNIMEDANGRSTQGLCELTWAKNRSGETETCNLKFNGAYMRFEDWIDTQPQLFEQAKAANLNTPKIYPSRISDEEPDLPF